jgi:hypothetical protein
MDIHLFHKANLIYSRIKLEEEKSTKLYELQGQIIIILQGHLEIPEELIFDTFHKIDELKKYVDKGIEKAYEQIDKLKEDEKG